MSGETHRCARPWSVGRSAPSPDDSARTNTHCSPRQVPRCGWSSLGRPWCESPWFSQPHVVRATLRSVPCGVTAACAWCQQHPHVKCRSTAPYANLKTRRCIHASDRNTPKYIITRSRRTSDPSLWLPVRPAFAPPGWASQVLSAHQTAPLNTSSESMVTCSRNLTKSVFLDTIREIVPLILTIKGGCVRSSVYLWSNAAWKRHAESIFRKR